MIDNAQSYRAENEEQLIEYRLAAFHPSKKIEAGRG